jgi:hypothetical protein
MELALILGGGGMILLLVGLIGGGFEFSGSVMPVVRSKLMRVVCLVVGGLLILMAIGTAVAHAAPAPTPQPGDQPPPSTTTTATTAPQHETQPTVYTATVAVTAGYAAPLFVNPWDAQDPYAVAPALLDNQALVDLSCTATGPVTVSSINPAYSSDVWYWTSTGYYIADADVFTGTTYPNLPSCG